MAGFIEVVRRLTAPYYFYIIALIMFIIFAVIGYYSYQSIIAKKNDKFKDVANANNRNKEAIVYFFHVDWCPHCKTALPEWNKFTGNYNNKEVNGYIIKCIDVNCTKETAEVTQYINTYGIESYPNVKLIKDQTTIEFDSKITSSTLEKFVNTMLD
jgi:thiol-disulfide isomerase/thioredoxin